MIDPLHAFAVVVAVAVVCPRLIGKLVPVLEIVEFIIADFAL